MPRIIASGLDCVLCMCVYITYLDDELSAERCGAAGDDQCLSGAVNHLSHHRTEHSPLDRDDIFRCQRAVSRDISEPRSVDSLLQQLPA